MSAAHPRLVEVPDDDATLVERAQGGDDGAFATLFRLHAGYIAGVAFRLLGDNADVDDVVQETFVAACRALGTIHTPDKVRGYLVTIAVRNVRRRLRRRSARRLFLREYARTAATRSDPEGRREVDALYQALDRLAADVRIPWILHRIEGQALAEVAEACCVSLATVKRRIATADDRIDRRLHEG